jgi:hypothetical protein
MPSIKETQQPLAWIALLSAEHGDVGDDGMVSVQERDRL